MIDKAGGHSSRYCYCTLFDINYADKGLVMCDSLLANTNDSMLYILAMDNAVYQVLKEISMERVVVVSTSDFFSDELKRLKAERTWAEFCWTCTASFIEYVFDKFNVQNCTYIDSDLFFYDCPDVLVKEMESKGKTVQIVPHRYSKMWSNKAQEKKSGKYCVQFNTFCNTDEGRQVLSDWKKQTLESCKYGSEGECGDQMYLNDWLDKYGCVSVLENEGAGVAPWNIDRYSRSSYEVNYNCLRVDKKRCCKLFFYHFQGVTFVDEEAVNIHVFYRFWKVDKKLVYHIYNDYLTKLCKKREMLQQKFGITNMIKVHPAIEALDNHHSKMRLYSLEEIVTKIKYLLFARKDIINLTSLSKRG